MTDRHSAVDAWFQAHDAYHRASAGYNARLELVRAERERGNWTMKLDREYATLNDAQNVALKADGVLYENLRAGLGEGAGDKK